MKCMYYECKVLLIHVCAFVTRGEGGKWGWGGRGRIGRKERMEREREMREREVEVEEEGKRKLCERVGKGEEVARKDFD